MVSPETSESSPPMTPATATGSRASQMQSISSERLRSTPSRVVITSPGRALRTTIVRSRSRSRSKAWSGWPSSRST